MTQAPPSLRKAALLIRSLDADSAAVLLAQLSPTEAKAVRLAIRELGQIDPAEQASLRDELRRPAPVTEFIVEEPEGVELDLHSATYEAEEVSPRTTTDTASTPAPFAWLEGGDLPSLAAVLEREHLSTVAVVLSYLSPQRASELLAELPAGRRAAALERLADLGESDRASLDVIEQGLAAWIASQKAEQRRRADRIGSVQAILRHSTDDTCQAVITEIAGRDRELASQLGGEQSRRADPSRPHRSSAAASRRIVAEQASSLTNPRQRTKPVAEKVEVGIASSPPLPPAPRFEFAQLTRLRREDTAELFRHCPAEMLVLALAGATDEVTEHVERQLPRSVAKELRRRMHHLSAIRLRDVTAAQEEIGKVAAVLINDGRLPQQLSMYVRLGANSTNIL